MTTRSPFLTLHAFSALARRQSLSMTWPSPPLRDFGLVVVDDGGLQVLQRHQRTDQVVERGERVADAHADAHRRPKQSNPQ